MKINLGTTSVLLVVCLLAVLDKGSCCELSWIRYNDTCYRIFTTTLTRYTARLKCLLEGSDLASIPNVSVLDFLSQHVAHTEGSRFWVGLDINSDNELAWFDGNKDIKNQPWVHVPKTDDSIIAPPPFRGGCFAYDGALVKKTPCYQSIGQICSYNSTRRTRRVRCHWSGPSFIGDSGNCLFRPFEATARDKVDEVCERYRAHFVDIDEIFRDGLTAFYNHQVLPNDGIKYWTGLRWNGTNLFWNVGHGVSQEYPISVVEGNGSCITVQFNFTDVLQTQFYQTDCSAMARVVCSQSVDPVTEESSTAASTADPHDVLQMDDPNVKCPEGYNWKADRSRNYCYWETSFETSLMPWNDAEMYCKAFGGHLGSFHSAEEERIGLSFQYGSLAHPYWIGLRLDLETETYKWSDGTPLDYDNWAPGHPNHKDKQLQCVAMEAQAKHWISTLCGIHSWFICKVPAKFYHPVPALPTQAPLEPCDASPVKLPAPDGPTGSHVHPDDASQVYFQGACYFTVDASYNWHRAKKYCEDQGASLVSIHSVGEIGFLLRLLHSSSMESNRVWIGLNSFGSDGNFLWSDYTGVDLTFFAENEPNNYQNQEKCCNMKVKNGEWSDENCNAEMGFVCKLINDTSATAVIPTTIDPTIGNCKKGWIAHDDRCYFVGGRREKDRVNWTEALDICQKYGSYLTSIRNENEQHFLSYLLQTLGVDAWIGLHDTIQSGRYYWQDNSELRYTNWAPGEPSFFGIMEDCVKMVYNHLDSGVWKDEECGHKMGYVCQSRKDPELPPSSYQRGVNCPHPEGWLKLDNMCFKSFADDLSWNQAEKACKKEGGHLVSVFDQRVKAVISYMALDLKQAFFIGLKYQKDTQKFHWLNDHPVMVSNWEKNEPSFLTEDTCFASTSEGYWKKVSCSEEMPYICQITTGKPPKQSQYTGECPPSSRKWVPGSKSFCYILDYDARYDWFTSNLMCFRHGSHLASIHSMNEIEDIKKLMKPGIRSVYIGLMRNKKGGFTWMDDSPVDFTNWDQLDPSNSEDQCAEMMADTMKWRLTPCIAKKHFICQDRKGTLVYEDPQTAEFIDVQKGMSTSAICAVVVSILIGVVLIVAAVLYRRRSPKGVARFRRHTREQSVSFENALYNVGNSSMEFHDDNKSPL